MTSISSTTNNFMNTTAMIITYSGGDLLRNTYTKAGSCLRGSVCVLFMQGFAVVLIACSLRNSGQFGQFCTHLCVLYHYACYNFYLICTSCKNRSGDTFYVGAVLILPTRGGYIHIKLQSYSKSYSSDITLLLFFTAYMS